MTESTNTTVIADRDTAPKGRLTFIELLAILSISFSVVIWGAAHYGAFDREAKSPASVQVDGASN